MRRKLGLCLIMVAVVLSSCPARLKTPYRLAFASDRSGNGDIFVMDEWGHLQNLTNSPAGDWNPRWSPDGSLLAFTGHEDDQADIWLLNPQTGRRTNLTNHPAWDYSPVWSPDGRRVAFISERDGDAELYIQGIGEGPATQLTFNRHPDKLPSWSPDGDRIAFATVINDSEQIQLLDLRHPDAPIALTELFQLNGTHPAWSPDGERLAFIGWRDSSRNNLYVLEVSTNRLTWLYGTTNWIGSLRWSGDGQWLFFTGRENQNNELMVLNLSGHRPIRLTDHPAWDDFADLHPHHTFTAQGPPAQVASPVSAGRAEKFAYGVNLADLGNTYLVQDIGFNYIKGFVNWATVELKPGHYRWDDPDNVVKVAAGAGARVLLRIHGVPDWARPPDTSLSYKPDDLADFERFMRAIAARYRGQVAAYEIWNEPNLDYEWGYRAPDPAEYTAMLKAAYRAIKAEDPAALVISAGLAPTGQGNPPESLGVLAFSEGMYQAGAKGHFDAMGSHLYTYGLSPDDNPPDQITFDQLDQLRDLMAHHGDSETPIWITEMGWVLNTHWDLGVYHDYGVSQLVQAQYLRRAYEKIEAEWPWVEAAFLFNLDFSAAPWYQADEQMRWFAILNPDRTPRPAFTALREMRSRGVGE